MYSYRRNGKMSKCQNIIYIVRLYVFKAPTVFFFLKIACSVVV